MRITVYIVETPAGFLGFNGSLVATATNASKYSCREAIRVASQLAATAKKWYGGMVKPLSAWDYRK